MCTNTHQYVDKNKRNNQKKITKKWRKITMYKLTNNWTKYRVSTTDLKTPDPKRILTHYLTATHKLYIHLETKQEWPIQAVLNVSKAYNLCYQSSGNPSADELLGNTLTRTEGKPVTDHRINNKKPVCELHHFLQWNKDLKTNPKIIRVAWKKSPVEMFSASIKQDHYINLMEIPITTTLNNTNNKIQWNMQNVYPLIETLETTENKKQGDYDIKQQTFNTWLKGVANDKKQKESFTLFLDHINKKSISGPEHKRFFVFMHDAVFLNSEYVNALERSRSLTGAVGDIESIAHFNCYAIEDFLGQADAFSLVPLTIYAFVFKDNHIMLQWSTSPGLNDLPRIN
jgi:hypothetical protein